MPRQRSKTVTVCFKMEEELARLLNDIPNRSAFIRKAIIGQLSMACPLCQGNGVVSRVIHAHYASLLKPLRVGSCDGCGHDLILPRDEGDLTPEDRARLEQHFHGGPLYCDDCFGDASTCDHCGWHTVGQALAVHMLESHLQGGAHRSPE